MRSRSGVPRVVAAVVAVVLVALMVPPATPTRTPIFGPLRPWNASRSANWSGYQQGVLEHHNSFVQISGAWTVPTATAHVAGESEAAAQWVGIGGGCPDPECTTPAVDPTLIQAGTAYAVDANGTPSYYAWWETLPLPSTPIDLDVQPGDAMRVDIRGRNGEWIIMIANDTTGISFSHVVSYPAAMTTAEWVLEAPTVVESRGPAPLPQLSGVQFRSASVNERPANLDGREAVAMADRSGRVIAMPSAPNASRDGFSVCQFTGTC